MQTQRGFRITGTLLILLLVTCFASMALGAEEVPSLPEKPDLNVTYISQRPIYPGYWLAYPDDVPTYWVKDERSPDGKREVTREEHDKLVKHQHAEGDEVTFIAHVRNNGFAPSPPASYRFCIDGKVVDTGKVKALGPDEEESLTFKWIYTKGEHTVALAVDLDNEIDEICEMNNRVTDQVGDIGLTIRAKDMEVYRAFRSTPNRWGSYSFEDWCQAHIQEWRKAFREAIYPATPQGVLQGIRFDGIYTSLDDPGVDDYHSAVGLGHIRKGDPAYKEHINWRIGWDIDKIPEYAKRIDKGLIHELCHQCGIIDLYQISMGLRHNLVTDPTGHFSWVAMGAFRQYGDMMCVSKDTTGTQKGYFKEYTAAAFNADKGRGRYGFGLHLFELPEHNVLEVLDNRGRPIPDAEIRVYQQKIGTKIVGEIPPITGRTDENGEFDMGPKPIEKIHVVGTNAIILIDIRAYGQWEHRCLTITEMNIAYWRGDEDRHVYTMHTAIAPPGSAPAPTNLAVRPVEAKKVRLSWDYPDGVLPVQKFLVLKSTGSLGAVYEPAFKEVVLELNPTERSCKVDVEARPRDFFVVVAVDQMGNRSGYSNIAVYPNDEVLPEVDRVFASVYTPDGSFYTLNSDHGTLFGLDPKGARLNLASDIKFDGPGKVAHMAVDEDGTIYVPNPGGGYVYRVDPAKRKHLENLECDAFKEPRGISVGPDGNIYVSDTGANKIHVVTKTGKLITSFGGGEGEDFVYPGYLYVDDRGLVYVVDCLVDKKKVKTSPGAIKVFKKVGSDSREFECVKTIDGLMSPKCVIADDEGWIYVGGMPGLDVFFPDGENIAHWTAKPYGVRMGATLLSGMTWDPDGNLVVSQGWTLRALLRITPDEIFGEKSQIEEILRVKSTLLLVNQIGYDVASPKRFLVQSAKPGNEVGTFEVKTASGRKTVFKGELHRTGRVASWKGPWEGISYWSGDFTALREPGLYIIETDVPERVVSPKIRVGEAALFDTLVPLCGLSSLRSRRWENGGWKSDWVKIEACILFANAPSLYGLVGVAERRPDLWKRLGKSEALREEIQWGLKGIFFAHKANGRFMGTNPDGRDDTYAGLGIAVLARLARSPLLAEAQRTECLTRARQSYEFYKDHKFQTFGRDHYSVLSDSLMILGCCELYATEKKSSYLATAAKRSKAVCDAWRQTWPRVGGKNMEIWQGGIVPGALARFVKTAPDVAPKEVTEILERWVNRVLNDQDGIESNPFGLVMWDSSHFFCPNRGRWHLGQNGRYITTAWAALLVRNIIDESRLEVLAWNHLNWIAGVNPVGRCMVKNGGEVCWPKFYGTIGTDDGAIINGIMSQTTEDDSPLFHDGWKTDEPWTPYMGWMLMALDELALSQRGK